MGNACDVKYVNYHVQNERATEKELGLPTRLVFGCIRARQAECLLIMRLHELSRVVGWTSPVPSLWRSSPSHKSPPGQC